MNKTEQLSNEELQVIQRIEDYFKSSSMPLREKVFHAILITKYELEAQNFSNESEREKIIHFARILDRLQHKLI